MKLNNIIDMDKKRKERERSSVDRRISKERKRVDDMLKSTPDLPGAKKR